MIWRKSIIGIFLLITAGAAVLGLYIHSVPRQQLEQGKSVMHTHEALNKLADLSQQLAQAEAAHALYLQTHYTQDYNRFAASLRGIQQTLEAAAALTQDNSAQQQRIASLRQSLAQELGRYAQEMNPALATASPAGEASASAQTLADMRAEEQKLLQERLDNWHEAAEHTGVYFLIGLAALYVLILSAWGISRNQAKVREQLLEMESEAAAVQRTMAKRMGAIVALQQEIVSQRLDLEKTMDIITTRIQQMTKADGAIIEMAEGDEMVYRAGCGTLKPFIGTHLRNEGSLSGLSVATNAILRCDDSEKDGRVNKEMCRKVGLRSMMVVPLIHHAQPVGVLKIVSALPHAFTQQDADALELMAGVLSSALRDALEAEALRHSHQKLSMSHELLKSQKQQLESDKQELKIRADTDGLTGLKNRRYFQECLGQEFYRATRYQTPLSLLLIDADHFKAYNDQYGHLAGDEALQRIAAILKDSIRPSDCAARFGGEEFAVILTQTDEEGALAMAERIRQSVLDEPWERKPVTISIGLSSLQAGAEDAAELVRQADSALYQAKEKGRNRTQRHMAG